MAPIIQCVKRTAVATSEQKKFEQSFSNWNRHIHSAVMGSSSLILMNWVSCCFFPIHPFQSLEHIRFFVWVCCALFCLPLPFLSSDHVICGYKNRCYMNMRSDWKSEPASYIAYIPCNIHEMNETNPAIFFLFQFSLSFFENSIDFIQFFFQ